MDMKYDLLKDKKKTNFHNRHVQTGAAQKKDMAELLSEVVTRNGNNSGNGGENMIAIQFLRF